MRKDFLNEVAKQNRIKQTDLMEKDLILHQILTDLAHNDFFFKNFLFKGGTCLTKCYLGYYRFSEASPYNSAELNTSLFPTIKHYFPQILIGTIGLGCKE